MYSNSYKTVDMQAMHQSDLEARTLVRAASKLQKIKENWAQMAADELIPALENNRKLWTILASEMADEEHPLPHDVRQNIANLALFIFKHSIKVMADKEPQPKDIDVLININMAVARGLNDGLRAAKEKAKEEEEANPSEEGHGADPEAEPVPEETPQDDDGPDEPPITSTSA